MKPKINYPQVQKFPFEGMDRLIPVGTASLQSLVSRIYQRYPGLTFIQINIIVRSFLEEMRKDLISGNNISLNGYISKMRLLSFAKIVNKQILFGMRVQIETPKKIKK